MPPVVSIVASVLLWLLGLYLLILFARAIIGWVTVFKRDWRPRGALLVAVEFVFVVTDPPIRFFGRLIPPLRVGTVGIDFGFLLTFVAVIILRTILAALVIL